MTGSAATLHNLRSEVTTCAPLARVFVFGVRGSGSLRTWRRGTGRALYRCMTDDKKPRTRAVTQPIAFADLGLGFNPRTRSYRNLVAPTVSK